MVVMEVVEVVAYVYINSVYYRYRNYDYYYDNYDYYQSVECNIDYIAVMGLLHVCKGFRECRIQVIETYNRERWTDGGTKTKQRKYQAGQTFFEASSNASKGA